MNKLERANQLLTVLRAEADAQDALTIHGVYDTAPGHVVDILMLNEDEIFYDDNLDKFVAVPEPEYTHQHWLEDQAELTEGNEQ